MSVMRAKVRCSSVQLCENVEILRFDAVARNDQYPNDGSDENNTYARFSPMADFQIHVANPALFGKFKPGDTFYVDFSTAPK